MINIVLSTLKQLKFNFRQSYFMSHIILTFLWDQGHDFSEIKNIIWQQKIFRKFLEFGRQIIRNPNRNSRYFLFYLILVYPRTSQQPQSCIKYTSQETWNKVQIWYESVMRKYKKMCIIYYDFSEAQWHKTRTEKLPFFSIFKSFFDIS